ncbi:hypothetical protein [uncultured Lutibacter sp.]|uniref:hypothetical protein n=1 Tax=uncultured Lutibacter sp. TaxID=437739 RepID=UPI00261C0214|nr:hypothetical protein [uncultured Lutibacter sp.]
MKSDLKHVTFSHNKSINELLYFTSLWISEFEFIKIELSFLKRLINNYPFKSRIPNLFEHIQLFILDLDNLEEDRKLILENIHFQKKQLSNKLKSSDLNFEDLEEEVFNYLEGYKKLKARIYQYISGLIK